MSARRSLYDQEYEQILWLRVNGNPQILTMPEMTTPAFVLLGKRAGHAPDKVFCRDNPLKGANKSVFCKGAASIV